MPIGLALLMIVAPLQHIVCFLASLYYHGPELHLASPSVPVIWCDNVSTLSLAQNLHPRSKHVELDVHFVSDKVLAKEVEVRYVPSTEQLADASKSLSEPQFTALRVKLGVLSSPFRLRGDVREATYTTSLG